MQGIFMKHGLLRMLVHVVNSDVERFKNGADGITLSVNGILISGTVIPRDVYYAQPQNETLKSFIDLAKSVEEEEGIEEKKEEKLEDINYLHLKDAIYLSGHAQVPTDGGTTICVLIDSVDAFNMGNVNVNK